MKGDEMQDYSKDIEYKRILEKEELTIVQAEFIYNEIAKVNWKVRALQKEGYKIRHLNPSCLNSLIEQYNKREDVNLFTGEIISTDTNKKDSIFIERGIPINTVHFMPDLSGSML